MPPVRPTPLRTLRLGQHVPPQSEPHTVGLTSTEPLLTCTEAAIVFKNEEGDGTDRQMTARLSAVLVRLAGRVAAEWATVQLRVTEAYDTQHEHGANSLHYQGRAADLTTWPISTRRLGRLAGLAVEAGADWVFYEDAAHVHVSVAALPPFEPNPSTAMDELEILDGRSSSAAPAAPGATIGGDGPKAA